MAEICSNTSGSKSWHNWFLISAKLPCFILILLYMHQRTKKETLPCFFLANAIFIEHFSQISSITSLCLCVHCLNPSPRLHQKIRKVVLFLHGPAVMGFLKTTSSDQEPLGPLWKHKDPVLIHASAPSWTGFCSVQCSLWNKLCSVHLSLSLLLSLLFSLRIGN